MEIRSGDQFIKLEFSPEGEAYVEWCDGLTRGMRLLPTEPAHRQAVAEMMHSVMRKKGAKESLSTKEGTLRVEAEQKDGYYSVSLSYVPEEDLLPWQWLSVSDCFREEEYLRLADEL